MGEISIDLEKVKRNLDIHEAIDNRILCIFEFVCGGKVWGRKGGFRLSHHSNSMTGTLTVKVEFIDSDGNSGFLEFPGEWLDPAIDLLKVVKSEARAIWRDYDDI